MNADALKDQLRTAILEGDDAGHGLSVGTMAALSPVSVWHDRQWEPRALVLNWPMAQVMFDLLGLTPEGDAVDDDVEMGQDSYSVEVQT